MTSAQPVEVSEIGDVITGAVIQNGLVAAAKEMSTTLERAAYNPLLFELKDYSAVITDAMGKLWAEAPGLIAFLSSLPALVQHGVGKFGAEGLEPGDVVIANDPFSTGTHIPDTTIYMPIFVEGELVAFSATTAHWADIGSKNPGGNCPDSIDVFQEGLCFDHVKLYCAGQLDRTLHQVILDNVRVPVTVRGDLEAQYAACRTGAERVQRLCGRYGVQAMRATMRRALDESERALRAKIAGLPDGQYEAEKLMDHDGVEKDLPRPVRVKLTISGNRIQANLTGSSPTTAGPINVPFVGTKSAINAALKSVLTPQSPANDGELRVVEVYAPPDTVVNPPPQAPCDSYGFVFQALIELTLEALSGIAPDRCPAGSAQLYCVCAYRLKQQGEPFIMVDLGTVGWGARPNGDGPSLITLIDGDTPNVPAEIAEARFPVRIRRHSLHTAVVGHGKYRGGAGVIREFEALEDHLYIQGIVANHLSPPRGVAGGLPGGPSLIHLRCGEPDEATYSEQFVFGGPLRRGQIVRGEAGGGAGWGPPQERDPARVLEDVYNEWISVDDAREIYAVAVREVGRHFELDGKATAELRRSRRDP
jgi:N-methylhydantoinase B